MLFKEGDKIAYPMNGAGVIESIEIKTVLGKPHSYYVLKTPVGNLKLMIPVDNAQKIGARKIVTQKEAEEVMTYFSSLNAYEDDNGWNKRYRRNIEKLKRGNLLDVAYVAKTLFLRDKQRSLSSAERKMFLNAKTALVSELALANGTEPEELEKILFEEAS